MFTIFDIFFYISIHFHIYYHIEEKGIVHMQKLYEEYLTMINSIERIMENKYESE